MRSLLDWAWRHRISDLIGRCDDDLVEGVGTVDSGKAGITLHLDYQFRNIMS